MTITETPPPAAPEAPPAEPEATAGGLAGTDHKTIGTLFVLVGFLFLVAAGVLAIIMRAQLSGPERDLVDNQQYRQLFTYHGVFGVFLFLAPVWIGLATALVPLQLGAARLAFPRLQAFSLWLLVAGGAMLVSAPFLSGGKVISGWTLNSPIPEGPAFRGDGPDMLILGLGVVLIAIILAAMNLLVSIVRLRAPGLTLRRSPLFSWSVLVSSSVLLLALPVLVTALFMLFFDRHYGGRLFSGFTGSGGGNPTLWPRLFWFAAYPTLWALLLPALGVVSEIIPVFSRTRIFSHERARSAIAAIGVLAFAGWGSEVANLSAAKFIFAVGALAVLAPVALLVLNWLATLGRGLRASRHDAGDGAHATKRSTAFLHALAFILVLAIGLGGAVVSALDATGSTHRTYWSVAVQHTLFFGAGIVAFVAALYYWGPKLWGRHLSEGLGRLQWGLLVLGLLLSFVPMYLLGLQDMGIHILTYSDAEDWAPANLVSAIGAAITGLALLLVVLNVLVSLVAGRGRRAEPDPWSGHTLEWATTSPPPVWNFHSIPEIRSAAPLLDAGPRGPSGLTEREKQGPSGPSERETQGESEMVDAG